MLRFIVETYKKVDYGSRVSKGSGSVLRYYGRPRV